MSDDAASVYSFVWQGREYRVEDLTLNDVAEIEDEFGESIIELLGSNRMRPLLYMVWLIRRRAEPDLTLEQVGEVSMADIVSEHEEAGGPPTEAAAPAEKKRAGGGSRGSRGTTTSARGKSGS